LPIGTLLTALILQALAGRERYRALRPAVPVILLLGLLSAGLSCLTGYLLSLDGDYDPNLVSWHKWMAISLTVLSILVYVRLRYKGFDLVHTILSLLLLVLLLVTGHLGGSLTHGAGYLTDPFLNGGNYPGVAADTPIANVQEARAYGEIIRPILQNNCYSCHGATRQKGGLRMDGADAMLKGGKDGLVILPGRGDGSELIKRLLLPPEDEHHMPPRQKKQLNERQLALLHWWIDQGADFTRKVKELKQPDSIRPALLALQQKHSPSMAYADIPSDPVEAADPKAIRDLAAKGVLVMALAQKSNWLEVDFAGWTGKPAERASLVTLLLPLKRQLLSVDLANLDVGDSDLVVIGQCGALRSLNLSNTKISDRGLASLTTLPNLRVLKLVGTAVSGRGLLALRSLKKLRAIYLYLADVRSSDWPLLKKTFPGAALDSGGYSIPVLAKDTQVVKAPKRLG
jgi:mono/diheme cytochrome c family protein